MLPAAEIQARLRERFGDRVSAADPAAVAPEAIAEVAAMLRDDPGLRFDNLMCLSAVDWPKESPPRLEVVYHLFSYTHRHSFVMKVDLPRDKAHLPTVENVWPVANWHEREAFDLFGIVFDGHSDLRRILLPDDWPGHPLRKDWEQPETYQGLPVAGRPA
jgi:NADH-quinone oxidoreductase subunit C